MKERIVERTLSCAQYIVKHQATLRQTAAHYGIGKSTVHTDLTVRLPKLNASLWRKVDAILQLNREERHLRGGESTRVKYLSIRKNSRNSGT